MASSIGCHLGVQFHPEVTPSILSRWVLDNAGLISGDLRDDFDARCDTAARGALQLFDAFAAAPRRAELPAPPQRFPG